MLRDMERMIGVEKDKEKLARWLGFLQAVLCLCEVYTLDELKRHNRPQGRHG